MPEHKNGRPQISLDPFIKVPTVSNLGPVVVRDNLKTTEGPFDYLPGYKTRYPAAVTSALAQLYAEYNLAFDPLVEANRESETDYQYCMIGPGRTPINYFVQIDMVGLPEPFLQEASDNTEIDVRESLRPRIFELENSLAMYQLLLRLFPQNGQVSLFESQFRNALDALRRMHGMPIALLAVTDQKYNAMRESEFGKREGGILTDDEVRELSGFDAFFGPTEFANYLRQNGNRCGYLLYVRSSDPLSKLRKPGTAVEVPLLEDDYYRDIIKAHAITFNIDNPKWPVGDPRRINDTKAYLPPLGMGYPIYRFNDINSSDFVKYLITQGIDPAQIASKDVTLRAKPMQASYGGYGHERAALGNKKFLQDLRKDLRERGPYIIQPEMQNPTIIDPATNKPYTFIDRNFFSTTGNGFSFMGGFRSLMPIRSQEAERGRIHGSKFTVWAEIH